MFNQIRGNCGGKPARRLADAVRPNSLRSPSPTTSLVVVCLPETTTQNACWLPWSSTGGEGAGRWGACQACEMESACTRLSEGGTHCLRRTCSCPGDEAMSAYRSRGRGLDATYKARADVVGSGLKVDFSGSSEVESSSREGAATMLGLLSIVSLSNGMERRKGEKAKELQGVREVLYIPPKKGRARF